MAECMSTGEYATVFMERPATAGLSVLAAVSRMFPWEIQLMGAVLLTVNYLGKEERVGFRNVWQLKDLVWMPSSSWDNCVIAYIPKGEGIEKKKTARFLATFLRVGKTNASQQDS